MDAELCDLCGDILDEKSVQCSECAVKVHVECYGAMAESSGPWRCSPCIANPKEQYPQCEICLGNAISPMKCTESGKWAHLFCAIWTPETFVAETERMEPVLGIQDIPKDRRTLACLICDKGNRNIRKIYDAVSEISTSSFEVLKSTKVTRLLRGSDLGACIQCDYGKCLASFHPLCAKEAGIFMKDLSREESEDADLVVFCPRHDPREKNSITSNKRRTSKAITENEGRRKKKHAEITSEVEILQDEEENALLLACSAFGASTWCQKLFSGQPSCGLDITNFSSGFGSKFTSLDAHQLVLSKFAQQLEIHHDHYYQKVHSNIIKKFLIQHQLLWGFPLNTQIHFSPDDWILSVKSSKIPLTKTQNILNNYGDTSDHCQVCLRTENPFNNSNELIRCSTCSAIVHTSCYGASLIQDWKCDRCMLGVEIPKTCLLCKSTADIIWKKVKSTGEDYTLVHMFCALWTTHISISSDRSLSWVSNSPPENIVENDLFCFICNESGGQLWPCLDFNCSFVAHALCCRLNGIVFEDLGDSMLPGPHFPIMACHDHENFLLSYTD